MSAVLNFMKEAKKAAVKLVTVSVLGGAMMLALPADGYSRDLGGDTGDDLVDTCNGPGGCPGRGGDNTANANAKAQLKANFLSLGLNAAATAISQDGCTVTTGWGIGGGAMGFGLMFNKSEFGDNEQKFFVTCTHYRQLTDIVKAMAATNNCPGLVYGIEAMATTARDQRGRVLMQGNPALAALNATQRGQGLLNAVGLQCRLPAPRAHK